jgi:hypothetical protein
MSTRDGDAPGRILSACGPELPGSGAPTVQLLTHGDAIACTIDHCGRWAEDIVLCTPALDSSSGQWPLWRELRAHFPKLKHAYVAIDGLRTEPAALHELYRQGCLRLVSAADSSFRVNLFCFRKGEQTRVLIGAGALCPPGLMASTEAMVLWEGPALDTFSLRVYALLADVRRHGRVPDPTELDEYARTYFAAQEHRSALAELGAPFIREAAHGAELPELEVVEDAGEIRSAMKQVSAAFAKAATMSTSHAIGFHGGTVSPKVHWVAPLGLWAFFEKLENRFWNAFGLERPNGEGSLSITVEINQPFAGVDRKVGGAFAKDPATGVLYMLHRGRIGGGQKGIGADLFWRRFRGGISLRERGRDDPSRVVVVGKVGTPEFLREVAAFVHEVGRIKRAAS